MMSKDSLFPDPLLPWTLLEDRVAAVFAHRISPYDSNSTTMATNATVELDRPGKPISLPYSYDPHSMTFLHRGQTQAQFVQTLYTTIYAPETSANRIWLLSSELECILTFVVCAFLLVKKKSVGKVWIFTRTESAFGTFLVPNAVLCLILGVAFYLVAWNFTAMIICGYSFAGVSSLEWWWICPAPWWPLVMGAYVGVHGFVIGCSPKSPLSFLGPQSASAGKWYHLPVSKSPTVMNAILIVPSTLFTISTFGLVTMSGRSYYHAKALGKEILPTEFYGQILKLAHNDPSTFPGADSPASDETIWLGCSLPRGSSIQQSQSVDLCRGRIFSVGAFGHLRDPQHRPSSGPCLQAIGGIHVKLRHILAQGVVSGHQGKACAARLESAQSEYVEDDDAGDWICGLVDLVHSGVWLSADLHGGEIVPE